MFYRSFAINARLKQPKAKKLEPMSRRLQNSSDKNTESKRRRSASPRHGRSDRSRAKFEHVTSGEEPTTDHTFEIDAQLQNLENIQRHYDETFWAAEASDEAHADIDGGHISFRTDEIDSSPPSQNMPSNALVGSPVESKERLAADARLVQLAVHLANMTELPSEEWKRPLIAAVSGVILNATTPDPASEIVSNFSAAPHVSLLLFAEWMEPFAERGSWIPYLLHVFSAPDLHEFDWRVRRKLTTVVARFDHQSPPDGLEVVHNPVRNQYVLVQLDPRLLVTDKKYILAVYMQPLRSRTSKRSQHLVSVAGFENATIGVKDEMLWLAGREPVMHAAGGDDVPRHIAASDLHAFADRTLKQNFFLNSAMMTSMMHMAFAFAEAQPKSVTLARGDDPWGSSEAVTHDRVLLHQKELLLNSSVSCEKDVSPHELCALVHAQVFGVELSDCSRLTVISAELEKCLCIKVSRASLDSPIDLSNIDAVAIRGCPPSLLIVLLSDATTAPPKSITLEDDKECHLVSFNAAVDGQGPPITFVSKECAWYEVGVDGTHRRVNVSEWAMVPIFATYLMEEQQVLAEQLQQQRHPEQAPSVSDDIRINMVVKKIRKLREGNVADQTVHACLLHGICCWMGANKHRLNTLHSDFQSNDNILSDRQVVGALNMYDEALSIQNLCLKVSHCTGFEMPQLPSSLRSLSSAEKQTLRMSNEDDQRVHMVLFPLCGVHPGSSTCSNGRRVKELRGYAPAVVLGPVRKNGHPQREKLRIALVALADAVFVQDAEGIVSFRTPIVSEQFCIRTNISALCWFAAENELTLKSKRDLLLPRFPSSVLQVDVETLCLDLELSE